MARQLTAPPALEPVTLAEAKVHLRVDGTDEDDLTTSLIVAARTHIERMFDLALVTQGWSVFRDRWPDTVAIALPLSPVHAVESVTLHAGDGTSDTLDAESFFLDTASTPPRLVRTGSATWPQPGRAANGIEIALTAGFGDAAQDVPQPIRQAVLLLAAHFFEHREPVTLSDAGKLPATVAGLVMPYATTYGGRL